jgi:hypothetical protein
VRPGHVELRGYPVLLGMAVTEHVEEWMREFTLMAMSRRDGNAGTTSRTGWCRWSTA